MHFILKVNKKKQHKIEKEIVFRTLFVYWKFMKTFSDIISYSKQNGNSDTAAALNKQSKNIEIEDMCGMYGLYTQSYICNLWLKMMKNVQNMRKKWKL